MSQYPPKAHIEYNFDNAIRVIEQSPLATLFSSGGGKIHISHLPLIYKNASSGYGKLLGHLDRNNPHCNYLDHQPVQLIFNGPDTYISPSYYTTDQLPTWNYIKIHMEGRCTIINSQEEVKRSMVEMTDRMEKNVSDYRIKMNDPKMEKLVNYVVGLEIEITQWEGRFKLSQDKNNKDKQNAKEKLKAKSSRQIDDFIETIYQYHQNAKSSDL